MVTPSNSAAHRSKAWMNGNLWPKVGFRSIQRMLELNLMSDPTHLGGERAPTWKFIQCHGWIFTSIGFHQDVPLAMGISGPFLSPSSAMIHADGHRAPILSAGTLLGFACVGFWWMSFCICALCWCWLVRKIHHLLNLFYKYLGYLGDTSIKKKLCLFFKRKTSY